MWKTDKLGLGVWEDQGSAWHLDARGGQHGIGMIAESKDDPRGFAESNRFVAFTPVPQDRLPAAAEQYVRGDRWHVNYPQSDGAFGLRMAMQPIESSPERLVLEVTVSIQTDLLDTHPKINIDAACDRVDTVAPAEGEAAATGSPAISVAVGQGHYVSVLLGPYDSPFTTNQCTDSRLHLRLFGDFLEKGVIRKARPWIVIDRSGDPPSRAQHRQWWNQLCGRPLPLTP